MKRKTIKIIIIVVVLTALGIWVKSRWRAWFVSVPETEYTTALTPDRITLLPGSDFNKSRIITWRAAVEPRAAHVLLACDTDTVTINAQAQVVENTGGSDAFYRAQLRNLQPGKTYSYKIITEGLQPSDWHEFTMPDSDGLRKLVFIGDVQDTIGGHTGGTLRNIARQQSDADAVIFVGDLIEAPIDKSWNYTWSTIDSLAQSTPIIAAAGNHEYRKSLIPYLDHRWAHTFAYDPNGAAGVDASYFINAANALIIVIDTQIFMRGYTIVNQYNWIKDVVDTYGQGKHKLLVMHHPPFSVKPRRNNVVEKKLFAPLADRLGFDAVLAGHEHGYGRFRCNVAADSTPLYVVSHCSPKSYGTIQPDSSKVVIAHRPMYQTIEFDGDSSATFNVRYRTFDATTHQLLDQWQK